MSYDDIWIAKRKGASMDIDLYAKAVQLLEKVANSIYERDVKTLNLIGFSTTEVQVVEQWLKEFVNEHMKESP